MALPPAVTSAQDELRGRALQALRLDLQLNLDHARQAQDERSDGTWQHPGGDAGERRGQERTMKRSPHSAIKVLAGTLIFSHAEMLRPQSQEWRLHLGGCHTIARGLVQSPSQLQAESPALRFLSKELSDLESLLELSHFRPRPSRAPVPPSRVQPHRLGTFTTFTEILRDITSQERMQGPLDTRAGDSISMTDLRVWKQRIDQAFDLSRSELSNQHAADTVAGLAFKSVIDAHHVAAIIYLHQVYFQFVHPTEMLDVRLCSAITNVQDAGLYYHDLFWPLFVLGTLSTGQDQQQTWVERLWRLCVSTTSFYCNEPALAFLKAYWARPSEEYLVSWIQYARLHSDVLDSFIIF
ncbi:uncharacterized protein AB675_844 [Cyphellophora attinorum]|uniref:Uncharacterized protein n=1 Tax=Cyphellophora attinorum TaxID=1664694 RepID=A0A0N0NRY3_9EURO|nr:uncharacterized protein AB675_844 [Phialophora attinorum]KPI45621.1 hypothetical protein AB675_844 [Phialophora attinorum]